jgi:membrane protease YdiL (CAAX protease family)
MPTDPSRPLIQAGVYILLCYAPVFFFGWIFLFVGNLLAGSVLAILFFSLLGNFLCFRIFDGKGLEALSMPFNRPGLYNSLTGAALGFMGAALVLLIPMLSGQAHEVLAKGGVGLNWRMQMFVPLMVVAGAAGEEILFRGFGFQILLRSFGPFSAILPIGVLFGFMHGNNPHASIFGLVNTALFGLLFGYAFVRTHDIWFPFGLHVGWNLTLLLFGANISGITMRITSYEVAWNTTPLWSGGEYGPEASVLTTFAVIFMSAAVWKTRVIRQSAYLVDRAREDDVSLPGSAE